MRTEFVELGLIGCLCSSQPQSIVVGLENGIKQLVHYNSDKQNGMVEDLKLFQVRKQVLLK